MPKFLALDRALVSARTKDKNGHMHVADVPLTRAEVNEYFGEEIPGYAELGLKGDQKYALLRDPEELKKALDSFNGKPLLDKHRPQFAKDGDRKRIVGSVHGAYYDAPFVKAKDFHVWDGAAIDDIEDDETSDISAGYLYKPDMTPGTFEGVRYDGVMRNIHANHIALVPDGRVKGCTVNDSAIPFVGDYTVKTSRKAQIARGALAIYLKPKLAQDASIDLNAVLMGTTAANWPTAKVEIAKRLKAAMRGKLAQDATMADVKEMLDCLDKEGEAEDDELEMDADTETKEEKEAREKKEKEAKDKAARDSEEAETEEEKAERMKRRQEARDKSARDAETPEAKAEREKKEKEARDKAAKDSEEPPITKAAMDAALKAHGEQVRAEVHRSEQLRREAEDIVKPVIGAVLAQDSAEAVYRLLFTAEGVNVDGVPPAAFKALAQQTVRAAKGKASPAPRMGLDAAGAKSFTERFPDAARIRTI